MNIFFIYFFFAFECCSGGIAPCLHLEELTLCQIIANIFTLNPVIVWGPNLLYQVRFVRFVSDCSFSVDKRLGTGHTSKLGKLRRSFRRLSSTGP